LQKLRQKNQDETVLNSLLRELIAEGALSDTRFTEAFIRARQTKGCGPNRISKELRERKISDELISKYINSDDDIWFELLREIREKKFGESLAKNYAEKSKQIRYLLYKGFTIAQIKKVM